MKGVHFLHVTEHQSFYKLRLLFLMEVTRFYGGPAMFIVTCFLAQPDCRNVLPDHCNTIIKPKLCGERFPLPLLQVDVFRENQGILQQSSQAYQTSQKKFASGLDTNNFTQSFTTKYHHNETGSISAMWCKNQLDTQLRRSVLAIWLQSFSHLPAMQDFWIISFFYFFP